MVWKIAGVRQLAIASAASQIADWSGRLVLTILIFDRLELAWAVGLVGAMFFIAWLGPGQKLASQVSGLGTSGVMMRTEVVRATMFALLVLPVVPLNVGVLAVVVLVASLADPVFEINRASLSVEVSGEDYGSAIKLLTAINQVAQLAGFAAGGAILAAGGERVAFFAIAVLFTISGLALSAINSEELSADSRGGGSLAAAKEFFSNDRLSLVTLATTLLIVSAAMAVEAIAAVYGSELALSESGVGLIAAALPAATFVGVVGIRTKIAPRSMFALSLSATAVASAVAVALFGSASGLLGAAAGYAAVGLALVMSIAGNVVVGTRIPAESRGAVFGVIQGVLYSTMAASAALGGLVAELVGAKATNISAGVVMLASAVGGLIALRSVAPEEDELPV